MQACELFLKRACASPVVRGLLVWWEGACKPPPCVDCCFGEQIYIRGRESGEGTLFNRFVKLGRKFARGAL